MSACRGCGGVLGRDCWNEQDCMWITEDMARRAAMPPQPEPCQGCSEITGQMRDCLGICAGATSWEDIAARAALWARLPHTFAARETATPQPT